jgi:hypothetical protein
MNEREKSEMRWEEFRTVAREVALKYVLSMPVWHSDHEKQSVRLTRIDDACLAEWEARWTEKMFDWREIDAHFKREKDRFEVAIWYGAALCGLCAGRSSNGPDNVTLHFLESWRPHNPLRGRIALLATEAADRFAKMQGKQRVKLKDPLPQAIVVYERLRFVLVEPLGRVRYYARPVG